jgi:hypothetical protein
MGLHLSINWENVINSFSLGLGESKLKYLEWLAVTLLLISWQGLKLLILGRR